MSLLAIYCRLPMLHSFRGTTAFPIWLLTLAMTLTMVGCSHPPYFRNEPIERTQEADGYRVEQAFYDPDQAEVAIVLAFSGGGSRASALAYGVLEELSKHRVAVRAGVRRLLDEVDLIYGVSGGAVTAAYFGAYGDRIFSEFVPNFLSVDFQWALGREILNPVGLTRLLDPAIGRGDILQERLDQALFKGITFGQMQGRPRVVLGATDLSTGARFEFTQNYFDLLCSDLSSFPVARAVAASTTLPLWLAPITLDNHAGQCGDSATRALQASMNRGSPADQLLLEDMIHYTDGSGRPHIHLVDGGLSDNLGIRGLFDLETLSRGEALSLPPTKVHIRRFVVITVNAATAMGSTIDESADIPNTNSVFSALVDLPMARKSRETELLVADLKRRHAEALRNAKEAGQQGIEDYYAINVAFRGVTDTVLRRSLLSMPTTWKLSPEQIELLRNAGATLVRQSPDFQRLLRDIGSERLATPQPRATNSTGTSVPKP
ncbi:patatin-like phospholipase family protein [Variovorax sp. J22R24]|uniref:patatin-like phospholipase family protein n=1 Tax=Variovorax gracilis TaxID=3053502 RepID=UPI002578A55B|nr:patatin-like phospholipase family protein [Variovorax sp. J22R24]MDM0108875.1 patatin-like phospholipase family protein [Variovorax sp. J22R24]